MEDNLHLEIFRAQIAGIASAMIMDYRFSAGYHAGYEIAPFGSNLNLFWSGHEHVL
ncbi:hypothetical protein [Aliiruegeria lutimaris]|uniref:hypothetical protein n=1 Tax=Aliiruegeria lutimaris TaxID=571298 RepID=UPI00147E05F9|nr:hypothetical protein [Aliiruegeria lutimaris]